MFPLEIVQVGWATERGQTLVSLLIPHLPFLKTCQCLFAELFLTAADSSEPAVKV